jgi:hypothetical protein
MNHLQSSTVQALLGLQIDGHSGSILTASESVAQLEDPLAHDPEASNKAKEPPVKLNKVGKSHPIKLAQLTCIRPRGRTGEPANPERKSAMVKSGPGR